MAGGLCVRMAFAMSARAPRAVLAGSDSSVYRKSTRSSGRANLGTRLVAIQKSRQECRRAGSFVRRALQTDTTNTQLSSNKSAATKIAEIQARESLQMPFEVGHYKHRRRRRTWRVL